MAHSPSRVLASSHSEIHNGAPSAQSSPWPRRAAHTVRSRRSALLANTVSSSRAPELKAHTAAVWAETQTQTQTQTSPSLTSCPRPRGDNPCPRGPGFPLRPGSSSPLHPCNWRPSKVSSCWTRRRPPMRPPVRTPS